MSIVSNLKISGLKIASLICIWVLALFVSGCENPNCISIKQGSKWFSEAVALEKEGKLQEAFRRYNVVSEQGCKSPERIKADYGAQRLSHKIKKAYKETETALNKYLEVHGHYPDSLEAVRKDISPSLIDAFNGFEYVKHGDEKMGIITGLINPTSFSLSSLKKRK